MNYRTLLVCGQMGAPSDCKVKFSPTIGLHLSMNTTVLISVVPHRCSDEANNVPAIAVQYAQPSVHSLQMYSCVFPLHPCLSSP